MKRNLLIIISLVSVFLLGGFTFQSPKPVVWEYKETCSPKDLNKLGADGWELASATSDNNVTCFYFKRAKN